VKSDAEVFVLVDRQERAEEDRQVVVRTAAYHKEVERYRGSAD